MKTWLCAALRIQDSYVEGFNGTKGFFKNLVASSLEQITSLVCVIISNVQPSHVNNKYVCNNDGKRDHQSHHGGDTLVTRQGGCTRGT